MDEQGTLHLGVLLFFCFTPCLHCEEMIMNRFELIGQWLKLTDQNLIGCTVLSLGSEYVHFSSIMHLHLTLLFRYPDIISLPSVKMSKSLNPARFPNKCYFAIMKLNAADPVTKMEILKTVSIKPLAAIFALDRLDDAETNQRGPIL